MSRPTSKAGRYAPVTDRHGAKTSGFSRNADGTVRENASAAIRRVHHEAHAKGKSRGSPLADFNAAMSSPDPKVRKKAQPATLIPANRAKKIVPRAKIETKAAAPTNPCPKTTRRG